MSYRLRLSLVFLSTLAVTPFLTNAQETHPWTVKEAIAGGGGASLPDAQWTPDGARLSFMSHEGFSAIDPRTGERSVITPAAKLSGIARRTVNEQDRDHRARYGQPDYFWSPDGKQVLFNEDGTLWLDDIASGEVKQVGDTNQGSGDDVQWSPDGKSVAFIHAHNIYVQRSGHSSEPKALTHTTDPNLLNGEVDWVYLEELKVRTNYSWSPDGKHIAYVQMDETKVPEYPIEDWIPGHSTVANMQKYPQAGDPNPGVKLGVVSTEAGETKWITIPNFSVGNDYIPRSGWLNPNVVWIETVKRDHKHMDFWFADIRTGEVKPALALQDAKFFDEDYDVDWNAPGSLLLLSWKSGHTHIDHYTYSASSPMAGLKLSNQLEKGDYEVAGVLSVDGKTVYYSSNEGDPRQSQVWAVDLDGSNKHQVTHDPGTHKVSFADGHGVFTDSFSSLTTPTRLSVCTAQSGACKLLLEGHGPVGHSVHVPIELTLKAADGVTPIYAYLVLPEGKTASASVPLINNPYGGPGSQVVLNKWGGRGFYFDQLLAEHGFAVLHVDNRGMGGRGREFTQACYHDFGKVQLADQLAAIDQVLAKYPQLDSKRLGWWGWSWGGTFTLNALTNSNRFRAGVSVAPVTDFRLYDSIYTERYMGLPSEEAAAYDAAANQRTAASLHGHLLIAHGTGDDNVHIMNTVQYVQKLIDAGQPYDLQIFPRKTHSIAGPTAQYELYSRILHHFEQYLLPETPVE